MMAKTENNTENGGSLFGSTVKNIRSPKPASRHREKTLGKQKKADTNKPSGLLARINPFKR